MRKDDHCGKKIEKLNYSKKNSRFTSSIKDQDGKL